MKKRKIISLPFKKHKISNLNTLNSIIGGTDTITDTEVDHNPNMTGDSCLETESYPSLVFTDCVTNDATRSIDTPTFVASCNALGSIFTN